MDELKSDLKSLGPYPVCISAPPRGPPRQWQDVTASLGKKLDLDRRYNQHGKYLVRALRKEGKLKGLYCKLFPDAAAFFDKLFESAKERSNMSAPAWLSPHGAQAWTVHNNTQMCPAQYACAQQHQEHSLMQNSTTCQHEGCLQSTNAGTSDWLGDTASASSCGSSSAAKRYATTPLLEAAELGGTRKRTRSSPPREWIGANFETGYQ